MSQNYGAYQKILDLYPEIATVKDISNDIPAACNIIKDYIKLDNVITLIGSVGKGLTARYLTGIFMHANQQTAIYNDIFFENANECITINNQPLNNNCPTLQPAYDDLSNVIKQYYNVTGQYPSMLLVMQMLSLIYLSKKSLDHVIVIIHQYLYLNRENLLLHIRPVVLGVTALQNSSNYNYELKSLSVFKNVPTYIMHKDLNIPNVIPQAKLMIDDPVIDYYAASIYGPGKLDNLKLAKTLGKHFMNNVPNSGISFTDILRGIYYPFNYPYRFDICNINSNRHAIFDTIHNVSQLDTFFKEIILYNSTAYHINPNHIVLICALWEINEAYQILEYISNFQPHIKKLIFLEVVPQAYYTEDVTNIKDIVSSISLADLRIEYYTNTQDAMNSALADNSDILFIGQPNRLVEGKNILTKNSSNKNSSNNNSSNNNVNQNSNTNQTNANQNFNRNNANQTNANQNFNQTNQNKVNKNKANQNEINQNDDVFI